MIAGCFWMISMLILTIIWKDSRTNRRDVIVTMIQFSVLALSMFIVTIQGHRHEQRLALYGYLQTMCWVILGKYEFLFNLFVDF